MVSTKPPSGMRDYLPDAVVKRRYVLGKVESVFQRYGFLPLETPTMENLSTLLGKYGDEGDQLLYRLRRARVGDRPCLGAAGENDGESATNDQCLVHHL